MNLSLESFWTSISLGTRWLNFNVAAKPRYADFSCGRHFDLSVIDQIPHIRESNSGIEGGRASFLEFGPNRMI